MNKTDKTIVYGNMNNKFDNTINIMQFMGQ